MWPWRVLWFVMVVNDTLTDPLIHTRARRAVRNPIVSGKDLTWYLHVWTNQQIECERRMSRFIRFNSEWDELWPAALIGWLSAPVWNDQSLSCGNKSRKKLPVPSCRRPRHFKQFLYLSLYLTSLVSRWTKGQSEASDQRLTELSLTKSAAG